MDKITKPMLAGSFKNYKEEVKNLPWPNVYATNKMDGIRCLIQLGRWLHKILIKSMSC